MTDSLAGAKGRGALALEPESGGEAEVLYATTILLVRSDDGAIRTEVVAEIEINDQVFLYDTRSSTVLLAAALEDLRAVNTGTAFGGLAHGD